MKRGRIESSPPDQRLPDSSCFFFFFLEGGGGLSQVRFFLRFIADELQWRTFVMFCFMHAVILPSLLFLLSLLFSLVFFTSLFFLNLLLTFVQCFHVCVRVCVNTCFFISIIVPFFCSLPFSRLTFNQQTYILCVCPRCLLKSCFVLKQAIYTLVVFVC